MIIVRRTAIALVALGLLAGCANSAPSSLMPAAGQKSLGTTRAGLKNSGSIGTTCPRRYTLGCVTITPSGSIETTTFSCSLGRSCPVPQWTMYNQFQTAEGKPASKDFVGRWDPNPYHSGPSTHTTNSIRERRPLKPSNRVEFVETLIVCPAQSSCTGIGTVGIIPTS